VPRSWSIGILLLCLWMILDSFNLLMFVRVLPSLGQITMPGYFDAMI
jgi:hypothetical protein